MDNLHIKTLDSILKIKPDDWGALENADFPFTDYTFFSALETTGCLGSRTGWAPIYLTAWLGDSLCGALILYAKTNSYGEYIFDFAWAEAAHSAGFNYYPKLISAIPFTPATGSKFLVSTLQEAHRSEITELLLTTARRLTESNGASSLHFLFIPENQLSLFQSGNFFTRLSFQYHWANDNYQSFAEFLDQLTGKRRREVLRERRQVQSQGVSITHITGDRLTLEHAEIMYRFYESTLDKKQGFDYLTEDFFKSLFTTMKDKINLVLAKDSSGKPVAGALNIIGSERLFGRYWGCLSEYRALHFEVCYYQGIEFCIQRGIKIFEAGAQGEHKFQRGFLPTPTHSAHFIQNKGLDSAVRDYVDREKGQLRQLFLEYAAHSPYS